MMAFEDSSPATPARSRYSGEGFRLEPDFREGSGAFPTVPAGDPEPAAVTAGPTPDLSSVFDDPSHGEPGRDRKAVHWLWELLLVVALAGLGYLLYLERAEAFSGGGRTQLLLQLTVLGLLAAGSAMALRAGAVNLAVGPVAVASGLYFSLHSGGGLLLPLLVVIGLSAAVGLAQGLVTVGLHVPAWAASLGVGAALIGWTAAAQPAPGAYFSIMYRPEPDVYWWLGGLCLVSVVLGLVGLGRSVRRTYGRFRPVSDPADRRGWLAAMIVLGATVGSSVLAGIAGVLSAPTPGVPAGTDALLLTALAVGVALLGGTSAFGRRGGVFGTLLASGVVVVAMAYAGARELHWSRAGVAAAVLGLGLVATRLVEHFGRPARVVTQPDESEDWLLPSHSATEAATTASWPAGKPYQANQTGVSNLWSSDDAWGTAGR